MSNYHCGLCGSDTPQHDCALVLRADLERAQARLVDLERVADAARGLYHCSPYPAHKWWDALGDALEALDCAEGE